MIESFSRQNTRPESLDSSTSAPTTSFDLENLYEDFQRLNFSPPSETTENSYSRYQSPELYVNNILALPYVALFDDGDFTPTSSISPDPTNSISPSEEGDDSDDYDLPAADAPPAQLFAPHAEDAPYTEHPRDRRHCRHLSPEQRVARSPAAVSRLSREQIQSISGPEIASIAPLLSPDQVGSLTRDQIRSLPIIGINLLRSMRPDQLAELTQQQMLNLRHMLPYLPEIIAAFMPELLGNAATSRIASEQLDAQLQRSIAWNWPFGHQGVFT